jgi:ABC-2 type transport system permease protein
LRNVRNIHAIWAREVGSYFLSPVAFVVIFLFLLTNGGMFSFYTKQFVGHPRQVPLILESLYGFALFWILPLSPLLTMKLFAEEKRTGTFELLMTAPVTELQVVTGKYLAAQTFYALIWISLLPLVGILWVLAEGKPDLGPTMAVYVGLLGLGLLTNAIGIFASALTRNQLVAAVLALSGNLLLFLVSLGQTAFAEDLAWRRLFQYLSFTAHFDGEYRAGIVDVRYLLFYGALSVFFLFLTVRFLQARRSR